MLKRLPSDGEHGRERGGGDVSIPAVAVNEGPLTKIRTFPELRHHLSVHNHVQCALVDNIELVALIVLPEHQLTLDVLLEHHHIGHLTLALLREALEQRHGVQRNAPLRVHMPRKRNLERLVNASLHPPQFPCRDGFHCRRPRCLVHRPNLPKTNPPLAPSHLQPLFPDHE